MITVYSKPSCVQCTATYRSLDSHGLEYQVVDVTTNDTALAYVKVELGYLGAPKPPRMLPPRRPPLNRFRPTTRTATQPARPRSTTAIPATPASLTVTATEWAANSSLASANSQLT